MEDYLKAMEGKTALVARKSILNDNNAVVRVELTPNQNSGTIDLLFMVYVKDTEFLTTTVYSITKDNMEQLKCANCGNYLQYGADKNYKFLLKDIRFNGVDHATFNIELPFYCSLSCKIASKL